MPAPIPIPRVGREPAEGFVAEHLGGLFCDEPHGSEAFKGGQAAADAALAGFDVAGYASNRNEVWPAPRRGASGLSPYIRHGLLTLGQVWSEVGSGPNRDVSKFRDELEWQEYARHWYARLGSTTSRSLRYELDHDGEARFDPSMACIDMCVEELEADGWLANQTRMWMASHWTVRQAGYWKEGEDYFFAISWMVPGPPTGLVGSGPRVQDRPSSTGSAVGRWRSEHPGSVVSVNGLSRVRSNGGPTTEPA